MELVKVKSNQFYVYRNKLAKGEKLPPERRRALITELAKTLSPDDDPQARMQRTLEELGQKIDALAALPILRHGKG